jgi:hypothetical protein
MYGYSDSKRRIAEKSPDAQAAYFSETVRHERKTIDWSAFNSVQFPIRVYIEKFREIGSSSFLENG